MCQKTDDVTILWLLKKFSSSQRISKKKRMSHYVRSLELRRLRNFFETHGDLRLSDLTVETLESFHAYCGRERAIQAQGCIRMVRMIFNWAQKKGLIFTACPWPIQNHAVFQSDALKVELFKICIRFLPIAYQCVIEICALLSLCVEDVLILRWGDLDEFLSMRKEIEKILLKLQPCIRRPTLNIDSDTPVSNVTIDACASAFAHAKTEARRQLIADGREDLGNEIAIVEFDWLRKNTLRVDLIKAHANGSAVITGHNRAIRRLAFIEEKRLRIPIPSKELFLCIGS